MVSVSLSPVTLLIFKVTTCNVEVEMFLTRRQNHAPAQPVVGDTQERHFLWKVFQCKRTGHLVENEVQDPQDSRKRLWVDRPFHLRE